MPPDTSSPAGPSNTNTFIPFLGARSRRGSLASITSRKEIDKGVLQQALDEIHTSEAKSQGLTCFHDFDGESRSAAKELVSSGVTGLYNKLRQSVVGSGPAARDGGSGGGGGGGGGGSGGGGRARPKSSESKDSLEATSQQSTSPSASRSDVKSLNLSLSTRRSVPEASSALSVPASPHVRSFASNEAADARPSAPKLHTAEGYQVRSLASHEGRETLADALKEPPAKMPRGTTEAPTREDVDKARSALADNDQSRPATEALARVLSHHEVSITERPEQIKRHLPHDDPGDAIDDSDYAEGPEEAMPAPSRAMVEDASRMSMPPPPNGSGNGDRPPLVRVGASHLPGFDPSRASSTTDGGDQPFASNSRPPTRRSALEPSPNLNTALQRRRNGLRTQASVSSALSVSTHSHSHSHSKRRLLDREFWMKDDNAKVCFSCGQTFSTFRRKHHCRTCGQIFDAKCTSTVSGRVFGQAANVRLCKPCEGLVFGDDDSTVFSDDDDYQRSPAVPGVKGGDDIEALSRLDGHGFSRPAMEVSTPSIGIPVSRRNREAKRRSAVIEFDMHPTLARPSSSHSLISLSRRPRSSSHHRRRHSRHHPRLSRASIDTERAPFHQRPNGGPKQSSALPTFHNDNVIDPDLAAFLSDDGSDEEDQPSIMSAVMEGHATSPGDREKLGFGSFLTSGMRKGRSRGTDKRAAPASTQAGRDDEKPLPKSGRHRNLSSGAVGLSHPSPRRSHSNLLATAALDGYDQPVPPLIAMPATHAKMMCSSALQRKQSNLKIHPASYDHVKKLLTQLLVDFTIPNQHAWHKALMPILMQCTKDVEPDVQHGDDMDIRHYIKLKKVPGGRPIDTAYVSGVVFSKNIALKTMPRSVSNPRILILGFSIEYARHESHFMSLDPVIMQEREYLTNIVKMIADLEPSVLFVQKHISGLALEFLEKAGIVVAYNIKASVLAAVARMTQTSVITSIDKLGMERSRLGYCENFDVKTYVSDGLRKNYIYLSGCEPDLGCTVVLRGADTRTLRSIKRICEFMCYVAYNLKLENFLLRDECALIPETAQSQIEAHDHPVNGITHTNGYSDGTQEAINQTLAQALENGAHHEFKYAKEEQKTRERILSASPFVMFMQPYILTQLRDLERRLTTYKMLRDQYAAADEEGDDSADENFSEHFSLVEPDMVNAPPSRDQPKAVREYLHAVHEAQLEKAEHTFKTQERQWDSFVNGQINPFDPFSHQKIVVLYSSISSTSIPCNGPDLLGIGFYASYNNVEDDHDEDVTIGQFVEDLCLGANGICSMCNKKNLEHSRQYVHGYGQLTISVHRQNLNARDLENTILMWSDCRICHQRTNTTQMSDATWKYSFAKYLELSFWSSPLQSNTGPCQHDMHKDFIRYFRFKDMMVRVQYDPIEIFDLVVPRARVTWKVDVDLKVKNSEYNLFEQRLFDFTESVKKRLESILPDALIKEKASQAFEWRDRLRNKVEQDKTDLLEKLQVKYASSRYYELIPLNRALRFMHEKAIEWDDEFSRFEEEYFLSETDIRKVAATQLRNMFLGDQNQPAASTVGSDTGSDTEDGIEMREKLPVTEKENAVSEKSGVILEHSVQSGAVEELHPIRDNDIGATSGSELARVTTPRKEVEEAVERDDVKHLDLAVPSQASPTHRSTADRLSPEEPSRARSPEEARRQDEPFAIQPKPLSSGLLERIEAIRGGRATGNADDPEAKLESKIPRLADLQKTDLHKMNEQLPATARLSAPSLSRTKSSPGHPGQPFALNNELAPSHGIDAIATGSAQAVNEDKLAMDHRVSDRLGVARLANKIGKVAPSLIPRSVPTKPDENNSSSVSTLAKHFDQMSREFEKKRLREREQMARRSRQFRANPLASSRPVVEVYQNATDAVADQTSMEKHVEREKDDLARRRVEEEVASNQPEDNPLADGDQKSVTTAADDEEAGTAPDSSELQEGTDAEGESIRSPNRSRDASDPTSGLQGSVTSAGEISDLGSELTIPEHKKNVWFDKLSDFWRKRSAAGWANLEYPLHPNEHVFSDSDIIVREDEPSSVIAFALSCVDYRAKVKEFRNNPSRSPLAKQGHAHTLSQTSNGPATMEDNQRMDIEASLLSESNTHMSYHVNDGTAKASCKVFYAQSFDALRRKCGVEERFVESMSRCLKFDSKGGKTKSVFLRTLDNRFIIKSLQEIELKAFNKFAPDYFSFMSHTLFHGVPSVIAKMLGLFQVNIRNPTTGIDYSYYLLVMENLFYERSPTRRFDLKGSMRNRRIVPTNEDDEVLLDENLVDTLFEKPLFVREHSRKLLQASIYNDTLWLCKQNVMDYSLMAGFDDRRKELIVGIIDCIRTYTWDKKLESWIKDRGKNKPTITSPKDYRNRFRVSMMQYVLQAPNCWHQFQGQMPAPKTLRERLDVDEGEGEGEGGETGTEAEEGEMRMSGGLVES